MLLRFVFSMSIKGHTACSITQTGYLGLHFSMEHFFSKRCYASALNTVFSLTSFGDVYCTVSWYTASMKQAKTGG